MDDKSFISTHFVIAGDITTARSMAFKEAGSHVPVLYKSEKMVLAAWNMYPDPLANWHHPYEITIKYTKYGDIVGAEVKQLDSVGVTD